MSRLFRCPIKGHQASDVGFTDNRFRQLGQKCPSSTDYVLTADFAPQNSGMRYGGITPHLQTTSKQFATVIRVGARSPAPEGIANLVRPVKGIHNLRIPLPKIGDIFRYGITCTRPFFYNWCALIRGVSCFTTHWPSLMVCPDPGYTAFYHPPGYTAFCRTPPITPQVQTQAPPYKNGCMRLSEGYFVAITVSIFRRWDIIMSRPKIWL